jgi:diadenosine tetraphosphate (Ap4A) HIT family hydrolase
LGSASQIVIFKEVEKEISMLLSGCVSCEIVAGKRIEPGGVIFENEYWHLGTAIGRPVVWQGFLIVKLKRHCEHLAELTSEEALALGPLIQSTCSALTDVLNPKKIYVCSYGDGIKHVHFWVLPRLSGMRPGMHSVMFNLDLRRICTRFLGIKKWIVSDYDVSMIAKQIRDHLCQQFFVRERE